MNNTLETALHIIAPGTELDRATALCYDGSFELAILAPSETVCSAGDDTGACLITTPVGQLRIDLGDWIIRTSSGRLARTNFDISTLARASDEEQRAFEDETLQSRISGHIAFDDQSLGMTVEEFRELFGLEEEED